MRKTFGNRKVRFAFVSLLIIFMLGGLLATFLTTDETEAAWYNDDYQFRQKVTIENSGSADTNKKVLIDFPTDTLITDEKIQSNFSDLRVTDANGKILDHYIDTSSSYAAGDTEIVGTRDTGGPYKIDDAGNPGGMILSSRQIIQTSTGTLYTVFNDGGNVEIWSSDNGSSWSQQDSGTSVTAASSTISLAIDSSDQLHVAYISSTSNLMYRQFDTTATPPAWNSSVGAETVYNPSLSVEYADIQIDANNVPHIAFVYTFLSANLDVAYTNRIGGTWNPSPISVDTASAIYTYPSLVINEDNIPEITFIDLTNNYLTAARGNNNDASSFTDNFDVDTAVNTTPNQRGASIGVDKQGNTWIAYIDDTNNYIALAKHARGDAWTTWSTVGTDASLDNNNVGYEPSIAVIGSSIFVYYENDGTGDGYHDIAYDVYDDGISDHSTGGSGWLGEQVLEDATTSTDYQDAKVRWSFMNNHDDRYLDFLFSDNTDIYWNVLDTRSVNINDASDFPATPPGGRQVVRKKNGDLYSVLNDGADLEVWLSSDGYVWEEQDSGSSPTTTSGSPLSVSIDTNDDLHIVYVDNSSPTDVYYVEFSDSSKTFLTPELVHDLTAGGDSVSSIATSVDNAGVVHTIFSILSGISDTGDVRYENRVGNDWTGGTSLYINKDSSAVDLTINDSNIPEVSIIDSTNDDLLAEIGNVNDATSFTTHTVDSMVSDIVTARGSSIGVDKLTGDTWISYKDSDGTVSLATHTGATWTSNWTTNTDKALSGGTNDYGNEPSLAIAENSQIYVFYTDEGLDIVYDVFDSSTNGWAGETILQTGTFQDVRAKWSFEWNNFGSNRIDYTYSDGTDVYWDFLYLRREPTKVDDASNLDTPLANGRQVVRNSYGFLYTFVNDSGNCEIWKSYDNGATWSQQDLGNTPSCLNTGDLVLAIDSSDNLHLLFEKFSTAVRYLQFSTSSDTFQGSEELVHTSTVNSYNLGIAVDSNGVPHAVLLDEDGSFNADVYYDNRIGGSWNGTDVNLDTLGTFLGYDGLSITISEDNIPEIAYNDATSDEIIAASGDDNDPDAFAQWNFHTISLSTSSGSTSTIMVDGSGNTWIAYGDGSGGVEDISLAKRTDGNETTSWSSGWTSGITNSNIGTNPLATAYGNNIYVFYEDDQDDIVYDVYDGNSWSGETVLEEHGVLQDVKVKWSYLNDFGSDGTDYGSSVTGIPEMDYIYSDGTDVFYNRLKFEGSSDCTYTCVYVIVPIINAGDTDLYFYYGNASASSTSRSSNFSEATFTQDTTAFGSEEIGPGPSAYWTFNDGQGTIAQDSTPNNNDADTTSTPTPIKFEKQINIIDQEYSTTGSAQPGDNSLGLIYWDADAYNGETVYFEALIRCDTCTGGGNNEVDVNLADDTGTNVSNSTVSTTNDTYTRVRTSTSITLADNEEYTIEVTRDDDTGTAHVQTARLIIVQEANSITTTETQVEIGDNDSTTTTTPTFVGDYKIFQYDDDLYDGTTTSYLEATIASSDFVTPGSDGANYPNTASITTYADATDGYDDNDWTTANNVDADDTSYASITAPTFDNPDYSYVLRARNFGFVIPNGANIVGVTANINRWSDTSFSCTDALVQLVNNSAGDRTDRIGSNQSVGASWGASDPSIASFGGTSNDWGIGGSLNEALVESANFGVDIAMQAGGANADCYVDYITLTVHYETTSTGTVYAHLYNDTNNLPVATVSANSSTWSRQRSSALSSNWDVTNDDEYKLLFFTDNPGVTAYISSAKIIVQQTGTVTDTEIIHHYNSTLTTESNTSYTSQGFDNLYDPDNFVSNGTMPAYFETSILTLGAGVYHAQTDIPAGEISGTQQTIYNRKESGDISSSLPSTATEVDLQLKNSASTTYSSSSWLKLEATDMAVIPGTTPDWRSSDMCIQDGCLQFNGDDNAATVTSSNSIDFDGYLSSGFSIMGWVRANSDGEGDVGQIFSKGTNNYLRITNEGSDGYADLEGSIDLGTTNATKSVSNAITLDKWHHVALTYSDDNDDEITIYVDGRKVGSSGNGDGAPSTDTNDLLIGGAATANFHGFIDNFKIYPYERDEDEIKTDAIVGAGESGASAVFGNYEDSKDLTDGLIAYWKMDDNVSGNGATISDSSGNGHDGTTVNGGTNLDCTTSGKFGGGCDMDGTNDYVSVTDNASLDFDENENFTLSGWFNRDVSEIILSKGNTIINTDPGYQIDFSSNRLRFSVTDTSSNSYTVTSSSTFTSNGWNHFTAVFDRSNEDLTNLYINGKNEAVTRSGNHANLGDLSNSNVLELGSLNEEGFYYNGKLDEVRVYNRALTPSEVQELYEWAPGPVSYHPLDENTGTTSTYDRSGNGYTGTLTSITQGNWVNGKYGSALDLDGSADFVDIGTGPSVVNTVSFWVNPDTTSEHVLDLNGSAYISISSGSLSATGFSTPTYYIDGVQTASPTLTSGTWQHVAVTTATSLDASDYDIGRLEGTDYLDGKVDDVKLYNYARTPLQIVEDMNAGHPAPGSPVGSAYLHWKFDEGYGSTAYNSGSGSGLDGTISNGTWTNSGKFGKAITFGATTSVSDTVTDPAYTNTISLWVYPTTSAVSKTLVTSGKLTTDGSSRPTYGGCTGTALSLSTWTHIAAVSDGSGSCSIYQNGVLTGSAGTGLTFGTSFNVGNSGFTGIIDDVYLFNTALTHDQVKQLFNGGVTASFGATGSNTLGVGSSDALSAYCPPGSTDTCIGPVGEWLLDKNIGGTAYDTSGNGNDGNFEVSMSEGNWTQGKNGQAIHFDGTDDHLTITDDDVLDVTTNFSLGVWFKPDIDIYDTGSDDYGMVSKEDAYGIWWQSDAGKLRFGTFGDNIQSATDYWYANTWYYVVVTHQGSTSRIYVNGKLDIEDTNPDTVSIETTPLMIGRDNFEGTHFPGVIDEVRLYNYVRTPAQIAWEYNRGGPVGWWKFDECSGITAYDLSENRLNATITEGGSGSNNGGVGSCSVSAATMWNGGATGKFNSSLEFDDSDDIISRTDTTDSPLDLTSRLSIAAWVKTNANEADNVIVSKGTSYEVGINADGDVYWAGASSQDDAGAKVLSGTWHHVVVTNDDTTVTYYVDGVKTGSDLSGIGVDNNTDLRIGYDGTNYFDGQIDDVRIYNYTLTAQQVKTIYNGGTAVKFGP